MSLPVFTKVGRISRDIELKYLNDGKEICKASIVFSEKYNQKENTCFIDFVCFGSTAKTLHTYFTKGDRIEGNFKLTQETWTAQDGSNKSKHQLVLERIGEFIEKKDNHNQESQRPQQKQEPVIQYEPNFEFDESSEIPF